MLRKRAQIESQGAHAGFKWIVLTHDLGHRCGYVLIPPGHPWYGKHYNDIPVAVHGGLTFSEMIENTNIWPERGYWIGFDCAHCTDAPDPDEMSPEILRQHKRMDKIGKELGRQLAEALGLELEEWKKGYLPERRIRGRLFVESQCKQLAAQCREAVENSGKK